jgi:hypothetical protein
VTDWPDGKWWRVVEGAVELAFFALAGFVVGSVLWLAAKGAGADAACDAAFQRGYVQALRDSGGAPQPPGGAK